MSGGYRSGGLGLCRRQGGTLTLLRGCFMVEEKGWDAGRALAARPLGMDEGRAAAGDIAPL